ncbi:hypothetical protein PVAG01_09027 [Phlyctema vagabunda]|uniref:Uncharacterized protein n=1 Tax=Phlyctema vagabunda TaxID=108571 RepID=A0ABR4P6T7_9HELO
MHLLSSSSTEALDPHHHPRFSDSSIANTNHDQGTGDNKTEPTTRAAIAGDERNSGPRKALAAAPPSLSSNEHLRFASELDTLLTRARQRCPQSFTAFTDITALFQADLLRWRQEYDDGHACLALLRAEIRALRDGDCRVQRVDNGCIMHGARAVFEAWRQGADGRCWDPKVDRLESWAGRKMHVVGERLRLFTEALGTVEAKLDRELKEWSRAEVFDYRNE